MTIATPTRMKEYKNKETLEKLYVEQRLSTTEIAEKLDCGSSTISVWLDKHGIDSRSRVEGVRERFDKTGPSMSTSTQGYETFQVENEKENGRTVLKHHRLLALLKYSPSELEGKLIHHKNEVPWDNRPENLELMSKSEHMKHHNKGKSLDDFNLTHDENGDFVSQ